MQALPWSSGTHDAALTQMVVSSLQDIRVTLPFEIKDISLALDDIQERIYMLIDIFRMIIPGSQCLMTDDC